MDWEPVIGLEMHVQLATRSKLFSSSATTFGAPPNSQASAIDLALPGVLPTLNEEAVRMAIMFGLAVNAEIARHSVFARKNYFYPDLPRGYQISQYEEPIVQGGQLDFLVPDSGLKTVRLVRAHLEEDAGKSLHDRFADCTAIDLNRAGVPLLEVVTEPEMHSATEASACLRHLHSLVRALGICDGEMAQGSLRCDVNVSLRAVGDQKLGVRTETKNLNSFRFVEKAIRAEIERQTELLACGEKVVQQTRLYDEKRDESRLMRSKEEEQDYRYFPDPDLLPLRIEEREILRVAAQLPELPDARRERLIGEYSLPSHLASSLAATVEKTAFFESAMRDCGHAQLLANWVCGELSLWLERHECSLENCPVSAQSLGRLVQRIADKTISVEIARGIFADLWNASQDVDAIIERRGLRQISDDAELATIIAQTLAEHPQQLAQYCAASVEKRKRMQGFFVGQAMRKSAGRANPGVLHQMLTEQLEAACSAQGDDKRSDEKG